ncbi:MAG TPA: hypothetical protein VGG42_09980 [Acidobacteriaceae bacterium]
MFFAVLGNIANLLGLSRDQRVRLAAGEVIHTPYKTLALAFPTTTAPAPASNPIVLPRSTSVERRGFRPKPTRMERLRYWLHNDGHLLALAARLILLEMAGLVIVLAGSVCFLLVAHFLLNGWQR